MALGSGTSALMASVSHWSNCRSGSACEDLFAQFGALVTFTQLGNAGRRRAHAGDCLIAS
jgi:hypothetical protein